MSRHVRDANAKGRARDQTCLTSSTANWTRHRDASTVKNLSADGGVTASRTSLKKMAITVTSVENTRYGMPFRNRRDRCFHLGSAASVMSFSKIDCCGFCKAVSGERLMRGMTTLVNSPSSSPATLTVLRGSRSESRGSTAFCLTETSGILRAAGGAALMGALASELSGWPSKTSAGMLPLLSRHRGLPATKDELLATRSPDAL